MTGGHTPAAMVELVRTALAEAAAGRLHPVIGQTFALERAADAHFAIEERATIGNTLLLVGRTPEACDDLVGISSGSAHAYLGELSWKGRTSGSVLALEGRQRRPYDRASFDLLRTSVLLAG
jgi:hypothetical protein